MNTPQDPNPAPAAVRSDAWARAKDLFNDIVTLPLVERADVLDARCGDDAEVRRFVETLLASNDRLPGRHDESVDYGLGDILRVALPQIERGRRFGVFTVVEELGRGGMGVVYLAERDDGTVAQRVALKLVPPGLLDADASLRLARERRLLAALEHPNIARLIDAGEDPAGIPYFAMEYVQGSPITAYCDRNALPLAARLRLFREVCAAVQHAHANLIVHCDLKAGNILVTDGGQPKLLDFGIATTLGAGAEGEGEGTRFLSPQTAAPEQFLGHVSGVATDVYALGVLLCELTSGSRPFDATDGDEELRRRVLDEPPRLPSQIVTPDAARQRGGTSAASLSRRLAGDIDAIVAKALAKSPARRYASVEQLDADVARHLALRPIAAREGEHGYRAARFLRRNAVVAAFTALVVVLAAVLVGTLARNAAETARQNERLAHERDQAQQRERQAEFERARAQQITDFMIGLFKASMPEETRGRDVTVRELLATGSRHLNGRLADQPSLKAAMLATIADAYFSLDDLASAEQAAREAAALREALPAPREHATSLVQLANIANRRNRYTEALELVRRAEVLDPAPPTAVRVALLDVKARAYTGLGQRQDANTTMREALALQVQETGTRDIRSFRVAARLASTLSALGHDDEMDSVLSEHLPAERGQPSADDPVLGETLLVLARTARRKQDYDRADALATEALGIYRRVYGERASQTANAMNSLANIAQAKGDYERSLVLFEGALSIKRDVFGEASAQVSAAEHNVGLLLLTRLDRPRQSLDHLRRALDIGLKKFPTGHLNLAAYRLSLGSGLRMVGRYAEAETMLRAAQRDFEALRTPRGVNAALSRGELACLALMRGDRGRDAAKAQLAASIATVQQAGGADPQLPGLVACAARAR